MNTFQKLVFPAATLVLGATWPAMGAEPEIEVDYAEIVAKHVQPAIDAKLIPGAVIGIYFEGQTSFYPIGTLNDGQDQAPTIDTFYEIGSISKVLTGVLFADAIRRGEVQRDTPVNDLLPDGFKVKSKKGEELQLWHLTTHTSGWATAPINLAPTDGERPFLGYTQQMMFEAANTMVPKTAPGENYEYSNFAVGLLGTLISINADSQYEQLVKDRVLTPLGIEDFTITLNNEQKKRLAPATASGRSTKAWGTMGSMNPAGMWITTTPQLLAFAKASIGEHDGNIYESLAMSRETLFDETGFGKVGFGWMLALDGSTYWHNGMTGGYSSYMAVNPTHDVAVVVLANGAAIETTMLGGKIIQAVLGLEPEPIKPIVIEQIDETYGKRLVGVYRSSLGFDITIKVDDGRVFAQLTGQQFLSVVPVSEHRFAYTAVEAEIEFDVPDKGQATALTLYQNGHEARCERVEE